MNEADTCRKFVLPKLYEAGWDKSPYSFTEQKTFTDGRIILGKNGYKRGKQKRADYLLRYRRDFPIAVVEAKADYKSAGDGMQQAKNYAEILGLKFAYATNGREILEYDYITGKESLVTRFPSPEELWDRLFGTNPQVLESKELILQPYYVFPDKEVRYYQQIAINKTIQAIAEGKKRILNTLATGTGKTVIAFQICWKLWLGCLEG
jgi:type I restriction enzyme R subunit